MQSSYSPDEVEILLKDITGLVEPLPAEQREPLIQSGVHYCEMLPLEYAPSEKYMAAYRNALDCYAGATAQAAACLAEQLYARHGGELTLVSLARAGIPIGILLRRYILGKYGVPVRHYAISIIRGRGIDRNAVDHILTHCPAESVQFVDGWIGKGAILYQLREALADYPQLNSQLAVLSDPAGLTDLCGTREDILIPSACLNATVTGLISRTFLRSDIIGPQDYHGAAYYREMADQDLSHQFLDAIEAHFDYSAPVSVPEPASAAILDIHADKRSLDRYGPVIRGIAEHYQIRDLNFIKPGIGETTRVLLRRIPWKVLVNPAYGQAMDLRHIRQLAQERGVPCEPSAVPLGHYKACGLIRDLADV